METSCMSILLAVTVTLNVILLSALGVFVGLNRQWSTTSYETQKENKELALKSEKSRITENTICIDCQYFGQSVHQNDTIYDVIEETECGRRLCCIRKQRYLQNLIERISSSPHDLRSEDEVDRNITDSMRWWRQRQNSAHLYLDTTVQSSGDSLRWVTSDKLGTAFLNGVTLLGSKLRVEEMGYYFIYAALSFNFDSVDIVDTFYQTITKEHPLLPKTGRQIMLMNKYGGSSDLDKHYTSFLCGTFLLQPGYEIGTFVSESSFISLYPYASYFGMYKL